MVTFIEIMTGVNAGSRFRLQEGTTIGRSTADIVVQDPKISATHAQVAFDGKGQLVLVDLDSSNGIRINGRRVKKVALISGVSFELGRTQFKIQMVEEEQVVEPDPVITWRGALKVQLQVLSEISSSSAPPKLKSFSPAIKLTFVQGIQADQEIILGYGPRVAGYGALDIELLDEAAPKIAFELLPGPGAVKLKVLAPGQVKLNDATLDAETLKDGDLISTGNSRIKVTYL